MSGPGTRSHRSSVRKLEPTLAELSDLLKANKSVVMITGAGLSAASGAYTPYIQFFLDEHQLILGTHTTVLRLLIC